MTKFLLGFFLCWFIWGFTVINEDKNMTEKESKFILLCNKYFGTDLYSRLDKVKEEANELLIEIDSAQTAIRNDKCIDENLDFELFDEFATIVHTANIRGYSIDNIFDYLIDKIEGRAKNPNYLRK